MWFLGQTTNTEWNNKIKNNPAPWAEIEIPNQLILTFPSSSIRNLNDMAQLAATYANASYYIVKLAALENMTRPERIVLDIQISAGKAVLHLMKPTTIFNSRQ